MRIRTRKTINTRLHRLYFFLWDKMYDRIPEWVPANWWDMVETVVEDPAKWILCKIYGHSPEGDQCGIPAHDFCIWCNRSIPYGRQRFGHGRPD